MSDPPRSPWSLERPIVRALIALVLLAVLAGSTLLVRRGSSSGDSTPAPAGTPLAAAPGPLDSNAPVVGQPAPNFALRDIDGKVVKLSDLRGKVVWVNFWATWCVPCKQELPDIQTLYNEKKAQGLEVLEVNWGESADAAKPYFEQRKLTLPLVLDSDGKVYNQYKLTGVPDSFFVGRDGTITSVYYGQLSLAKMREHLATAGLP